MAIVIRTDCRLIERDAQKLKELADAVPAFLKELESALHQLDRCWEGPAWNTYQNTNAEYVEELNELHKFYVEISGKMMQSSQNYMRAEQDVMVHIDSVGL